MNPMDSLRAIANGHGRPPWKPVLHHMSSAHSQTILFALEQLSAANGLVYDVKAYERIGGLAPPELKEVHPLGKSPVLVLEPPPTTSSTLTSEAAAAAAASASPDVPEPKLQPIILAESAFILQHLATHYDTTGIWKPSNPADEIRDRFFQEYANGSLAPRMDFVTINVSVTTHAPVLARPLLIPIFRPIIAFWKSSIVVYLEFLEHSLSSEEGDAEEAGSRRRRRQQDSADGDGGSRWFSGSKLGLADIEISWPIDNAMMRGYLPDREEERNKKYPKLMEWYGRIVKLPAYQRAVEKGGGYAIRS